MRVIANALGLRNEFMRSDRDNFITLAPNANSLVAANLQSLDIFAATKKYTNASATNQGPFDARSITMVTGEQWAQNIGKPVFTLNMNPNGRRWLPASRKFGSIEPNRLWRAKHAVSLQNSMWWP